MFVLTPKTLKSYKNIRLISAFIQVQLDSFASKPTPQKKRIDS